MGVLSEEQKNAVAEYRRNANKRHYQYRLQIESRSLTTRLFMHISDFRSRTQADNAYLEHLADLAKLDEEERQKMGIKQAQ
jgi:ribosomal protein L18